MVVRFLCGSLWLPLPVCFRLTMSQHSVTLSWILTTFPCRSRPTAGYSCGCPVRHMFVKKLSVNRVHWSSLLGSLLINASQGGINCSPWKRKVKWSNGKGPADVTGPLQQG